MITLMAQRTSARPTFRPALADESGLAGAILDVRLARVYVSQLIDPQVMDDLDSSDEMMARLVETFTSNVAVAACGAVSCVNEGAGRVFFLCLRCRVCHSSHLTLRSACKAEFRRDSATLP